MNFPLGTNETFNWDLFNMALLKIEQGHFETAILIHHNFSSFITATDVSKYYIEYLHDSTRCTVMQLFNGSYFSVECSFKTFLTEFGYCEPYNARINRRSLRKKCSAISAIIAILRKVFSSDHFDSDRSDNDRWDRKSSISAIVVTAIAGKWFPYDCYDRCDRWTFFLLSDRNDHMEAGL